MATRARAAGVEGMFHTQRADLWWVPPLTIAIGFTTFVLYSLWAAFLGGGAQVVDGQEMAAFHYTGHGANYLSPFYSPCVTDACAEGPLAGLLPSLAIGAYVLPPALFILWAPLGFRATCYYYRKAYYRAYFLDPPACAVEEGRHKYRGERSFPFILQNLHRYFLPFALLLIAFLAYDAILAFRFAGGWGVGVGSLVLTANVLLLASYTFGCHSLRHVVGGRLDCMTCPARPGIQHGAWRFVSWFNRHHMLWAWSSLVSVGFADLYVRLLTSGVLTDVRLL